MNEDFKYLFNRWVEFSYDKKVYFVKIYGNAYTEEQPLFDGIIVHRDTKQKLYKVWPAHALSRMTRDGAIVLTEQECKTMDILYDDVR